MSDQVERIKAMVPVEVAPEEAVEIYRDALRRCYTIMTAGGIEHGNVQIDLVELQGKMVVRAQGASEHGNYASLLGSL